MANEIHYSFDSADTLYALIRRVEDQYIYDVVDEAFEKLGTWNDARVIACAVEMTTSGDTHWADFPVVDGGVYFVEIREQTGANPDTDDLSIAQGILYWNGTEEINDSTMTNIMAHSRSVFNVYDERK